jgi:hypothetical protein
MKQRKEAGMNAKTPGKARRIVISILVAVAVLGGFGAGVATSTSDTHAAIKWNTGGEQHGKGHAYGHFK